MNLKKMVKNITVFLVGKKNYKVAYIKFKQNYNDWNNKPKQRNYISELNRIQIQIIYILNYKWVTKIVN